VGTLADTTYLTARQGRVSSGHVEHLRKVEDESLLLVTEGELSVDTKDEVSDTFAPACLAVGDAVFVPANSQLRVLVRSGLPARYLIGAARPVPEGWMP